MPGPIRMELAAEEPTGLDCLLVLFSLVLYFGAVIFGTIKLIDGHYWQGGIPLGIVILFTTAVFSSPKD